MEADKTVGNTIKLQRIFLLLKLPSQAQSGGATAASVPGSGEGDSVPAPGPGRTTMKRKRCTRGSREPALA